MYYYQIVTISFTIRITYNCILQCRRPTHHWNEWPIQPASYSETVQNLASGLWTLDWNLDWVLDWIMD